MFPADQHIARSFKVLRFLSDFVAIVAVDGFIDFEAERFGNREDGLVGACETAVYR